jgi:hypothetical protein
MATDLVPKSSKKFHCNFCDYYTSRKSQYDRHVSTDKHKNQQNQPFSTKKVPKSSTTFECNCGKKYKDRTGLWRHKIKCDKNNINQTNLYSEEADKSEDKDIIMLLIKENSDLKSMMMEVIKNGTHNTTNNNTNSHNKAFNLNFFLNETCKDAMNIMDFVDSIKLQLTDLERVGELGYVEGISNIIVKNLKELDVTERPVHCTDKKRDVLYIKDEDKWEKDEEKKKMHKVIKKVADKNARLLPKFKEAHPDCIKASSKFSDQYNKIIIESMGGSGDNDFEKEEKIIKNISKQIVIEK